MGNLTQEQILHIAQRRGYFFISPKWRYDRLRKQCRKMVKKGILKREHWKKFGLYGDYFVCGMREVDHNEKLPD